MYRNPYMFEKNLWAVFKLLNTYVIPPVADVEIELLKEAPSLETLDLRYNPLTARCHDQLVMISSIDINVTPRETEDWEDLTIWSLLVNKRSLKAATSWQLNVRAHEGTAPTHAHLFDNVTLLTLICSTTVFTLFS